MSRMMMAMNRSTFLVLTAALTSSLVLGCSKPKAPTLTPEATRVTTVTPEGIGVRVTLNAYNPNDFALTTQAVKATIVLGNKVKLGPVEKPHGVSLPADSTTKVTIDLQATWQQAAQIAQLASSGPTIPYVVEGTVKIGGSKLNLELPFTIKGEVSQAQLIAAGIKGLPSIPGLPVFK